MRTLETQMRLRRLLRVHSEFRARLGAPDNLRLAGAAQDRLLRLTGDLKLAWDQESSSAPPDDRLEPLRRHVARAIRGLELAVATIDRPGADLDRMAADFQEIALPLVFCLRGLEQYAGCQLALLIPELARSA